MKVVFLTTIPSPYRVAFFNEWGKLCELTVIFERKSSADRDIIWKNIDIKNFSPIFLEGINIKANKAFCPSIIKYIKELDFDMFVIGGYNTPTAMLAAEWLRKKRIPYVLNADGGYVKRDRVIAGKIKQHFIAGASMWICTSEKTKEYFIYYGANSKLIRKYPFTSLYHKNILEQPVSAKEKKQIRIRLGILEDKVVLSVGQFIYRKGFDILLKAKASLADDVGIYIIGGTETKEYRAIVEDLKLQNIHFLPFMKSESLTEYYKASDVFAFPTREDIWGLVINEAAAYGLPIITTNRCIAGEEIIEDGVNGFLIPIDETNLLAKRISELLEDRRLSAEFSQRVLTSVSNYTYEEMARIHVDIAEEFMKLYGKR